MIRRMAALAAAVALSSILACAATLGLSAGSASASPPVVLVSTDGISYEPSLAVGLFADAGLLVPGDTATSELWIKNPSATPATVRVNVGDVTSSSVELADNVELTAVNTWNGSTVTASWSDLAQCDVLVEPVTIPGGAVLHVALSLTMLNAAGLVAQHQNAALVANVQMEDAAGGSFPPSECDPGTLTPGALNPGAVGPGNTEPAATHPRTILGYTGDTFPTQLLILGGVLVGVGWFLVVARRRRKREEAQQ